MLFISHLPATRTSPKEMAKATHSNNELFIMPSLLSKNTSGEPASAYKGTWKWYSYLFPKIKAQPASTATVENVAGDWNQASSMREGFWLSEVKRGRWLQYYCAFLSYSSQSNKAAECKLVQTHPGH